jgi:hypothetical protein
MGYLGSGSYCKNLPDPDLHTIEIEWSAADPLELGTTGSKAGDKKKLFLTQSCGCLEHGPPVR